MENEREEEPLTIYLSGSEGAETRLNLSDASLNFMRFFIHLLFFSILLLAIFCQTTHKQRHLIWRTHIQDFLSVGCRGSKNWTFLLTFGGGTEICYVFDRIFIISFAQILLKKSFFS